MRLISRARSYLSELWRSDRRVAWIVVLYAVTQLAAIGWDLPGSYGWENDGVAPRDLFGGLAFNLTPGQGHRYPLFHYLLLALLCLPILLPAALMADSWSMADLMDNILSVPVMTAVAVVAKLLAVAMSVVTVLVLARIARRTISTGAARWTTLFAVTCLSVAYYGRVTNLDGPYLMWTVLALDRLLDVAERGGGRDYRLFFGFAAAAVATKDQAYATFLLVVPLFLIALPIAKPGMFAARRRHWSRLVGGAAVGVLAYGLLSGALLNPTGFVTRVETLLGPSSQEWRHYASGVGGMAANLADIARSQARFWWPWPLVGLCWLGVAIALLPRRSAPPRHASEGVDEAALRSKVWSLLPLIAAVSGLLGFTLVVARCEHRFLMPFGLFLAIYGGLAADAGLRLATRWGRPAARALWLLLAAAVAWGGLHSFQVHLTQWGDARRQVSALLEALRPGSVVETYGLVVYQPHFDLRPEAPYRVQRVGLKPAKQRNQMLRVEEIEGEYGAVAERRPDVLVVTEGYASRYVNEAAEGVRSASTIVRRAQANDDATRFFQAAVADELPGYRVALVAEPELPGWARTLGLRPQIVHGSTGRRVWVLERESEE